MTGIHRLPPSQKATVAAVGEHAYKRALRATPGGEVWVELIPEPDNPYDPNAISVRYRGGVIAYIPRDRTSRYWNNICRIVASGKTPTAKAKVYHSNNDWHEVSLFILAGDRGLGSTAGLVPKANSYDVPGAYGKVTTFGVGASGGRKVSAPSQKFGAPRPSEVVFTDRDRQLEAQRRRLEQEKTDRTVGKKAAPAGKPESDGSKIGTIVVIVAILFLLLLLIL